MSIELLQTVDVIEIMENFIEKIRPPEEIRKKVDITYKIENQSVIIYEVRPHWEKPGQMIESVIGKATFVKENKHWKIFWRRANSKWQSYKPKPHVKTLNEFVKIIDEDKNGCFWG